MSPFFFSQVLAAISLARFVITLCQACWDISIVRCILKYETFSKKIGQHICRFMVNHQPTSRPHHTPPLVINDPILLFEPGKSHECLEYSLTGFSSNNLLED